MNKSSDITTLVRPRRWKAVMYERAAARVAAWCSAAPPDGSEDDLLGRILLAKLRHADSDTWSHVGELLNRVDTPTLAPELVAVVEALRGVEPLVALGALGGDLVIALDRLMLTLAYSRGADDDDGDDYHDDGTPHEPIYSVEAMARERDLVRAAAGALVAVGTCEALRCVLRHLDRLNKCDERGEARAHGLESDFHEVLRGAGAALIEPALAEWPHLANLVREGVVRALSHVPTDARIVDALSEWLIDDPWSALDAVVVYPDVRCAFLLSALLNRCLLHRNIEMAWEVCARLDAVNLRPSDAQVARLATLAVVLPGPRLAAWTTRAPLPSVENESKLFDLLPVVRHWTIHVRDRRAADGDWTIGQPLCACDYEHAREAILRARKRDMRRLELDRAHRLVGVCDGGWVMDEHGKTFPNVPDQRDATGG
jgi:hypothetical protein